MFASIALFAVLDGFATPILWAAISLVLIGVVMSAVPTNGNGGKPAIPKEWKRLPSGVYLVPIELLERHSRNRREADVYKQDNANFRSLDGDFSNGWRETEPATILWDGKKGRMLKGNRRLAVAQKRAIPLVPCIVMTGLTEREELQVLFDHGNTLPLTAVETFQEFADAMRSGWDKADIMAMMGWTGKRSPENYWNKFERVYISPPSVQKDWERYTKDSADVDGMAFVPTADAMTKIGKKIKEIRVKKPGVSIERTEDFRDLVVQISTDQKNPPTDPSGGYDKKALQRLRNGVKVPLLEAFLTRLAGDTTENPNPLVAGLVYCECIALGCPVGMTMPDRPDILDRFLPTTADTTTADTTTADTTTAEPTTAEPTTAEPTKGTGKAHKATVKRSKVHAK